MKTSQNGLPPGYTIVPTGNDFVRWKTDDGFSSTSSDAAIATIKCWEHYARRLEMDNERLHDIIQRAGNCLVCASIADPAQIIQDTICILEKEGVDDETKRLGIRRGA